MPRVQTSRGNLWIADHRHHHSSFTSIVIHGAGGTHLSFPKELRTLKSINPIFVSLNGHGLSHGDGHETIEDHALDILALMHTLEIQESVFIGHSMGGAISQWLAIHNPKQVKGLVLIATAPKFAINPVLVHSIIQNPDDTITLLNEWMWSDATPEIFRSKSVDMMKQIAPSIIQKDYIAASHFDVTHELKKIDAPTLIMVGEKDQIVEPELSHQLADRITGSTIHTIPDTGHMLHLEHPDKTAKIIDRWITQLGDHTNQE